MAEKLFNLNYVSFGFLPNCCSLSEARGKSSCSCSGRGSGKLNHIVMIIHGGTHKLRRQEWGRGFAKMPMLLQKLMQ